MACKRYGLGGQIIPFWKRQIEALPKWQKGDPQIRLFLPTFWMKMVKPPQHTPNNQVYFVTHPQMTKMDIKNYLEKIYDVPVHSVRTSIKLTRNACTSSTLLEQIQMKNMPVPDPVRDKMKTDVRWSEEYKEAVVVLGEGQTFDFPDIESVIIKDRDEVYNKMDGEAKEQVKTAKGRENSTGGVPSWFF